MKQYLLSIAIITLNTINANPLFNLRRRQSVLTNIEDFGRGIGEGATDAFDGVKNTVEHPINTLEGVENAVTHPGETINNIETSVQDCFQKNVPECLGKGAFNVGLAVATDGAGEVAEGVADAGEIADIGAISEEIGEEGETIGNEITSAEDSDAPAVLCRRGPGNSGCIIPTKPLNKFDPQTRQAITDAEKRYFSFSNQPDNIVGHSRDGTRFGNYEGKLPKNQQYTEYGIATPSSRSGFGPRRVVIGNNDGKVYFTGDHYTSFTQVVERVI